MELALDQTAAVETHLRKLQWIAPQQTVTGLEIAGAGNMNRTLRVLLADGSLILKQSLPFVARYPDIPAPVERLDVEAAFYRAVGDEPAIAERMPQLIGYDQHNHLLGLQDLGATADFSSHYDLTQDHDPLPTAALLNWLSALHSLPLDGIENPGLFANTRMRELNHAHIFRIPLDSANGLELADELKTVAAQFVQHKRLQQRAAELGELYLAPRPQLPEPALLHGDYYPGSWLAADEGIYVIDVEFAFLGPVEFDLGVFMAHCIMTGTDPDAVPGIVSDYHGGDGFNLQLAQAFAGMEIIRRLLGVAQLPWIADWERKLQWLDWSREMLTT